MQLGKVMVQVRGASITVSDDCIAPHERAKAHREGYWPVRYQYIGLHLYAAPNVVCNTCELSLVCHPTERTK